VGEDVNSGDGPCNGNCEKMGRSGGKNGAPTAAVDSKKVVTMILGSEPSSVFGRAFGCGVG
jgi:hypothetical protein